MPILLSVRNYQITFGTIRWFITCKIYIIKEVNNLFGLLFIFGKLFTFIFIASNEFYKDKSSTRSICNITESWTEVYICMYIYLIYNLFMLSCTVVYWFNINHHKYNVAYLTFIPVALSEFSKDKSSTHSLCNITVF